MEAERPYSQTRLFSQSFLPPSLEPSKRFIHQFILELNNMD